MPSISRTSDKPDTQSSEYQRLTKNACCICAAGISNKALAVNHLRVSWFYVREFLSIFAADMAKKIEKTNAARLLDKAGIAYKLIPYEFDENDLAAQHVADSLGQDIARVFKTLVLHGDKTGHIVCVVPGDAEVNLKALAKASDNKKVEMIAMKDLLAVTGYIRGGCSPVGMKKRFPTFFHSTSLDFETIYVSAGVRGLQLEISPSDLIAFVGGTVADVASFDI